jgi:hypothetical protein
MAKKTKERSRVAKGVDGELMEYLRIAEEALISALQLFGDHPKLERRIGYLTRLVRAQELVTGVYAEELVRARGPHKVKRRK